MTLVGHTLTIDIGGTGTKIMLLDRDGRPAGERRATPTPRPATPESVLGAIEELIEEERSFERVSCGFPGVVNEGVVHTAPNLDGGWSGFDLARALEKLTGKPSRVCNDADVQGLGMIEGRGVELVITLGTGLGAALFIDGRLVPNLELAHHPFKKNATYEQYVGKPALERVGKKKWRKRVRKVIEQLDPIFNYRVLYIGGGNAKKLACKLPDNVRIGDNLAGLLGGIRLWSQESERDARYALAV